MEYEVKCPSGMVGVIRPLKVADEKLLTNKQLLNSGKIVAELCKRAWVRMIDPGPYTFKDDKVVWEELLQGDIFFLFFQLRKYSYGVEYEFSYRCTRCDKLVTTTVNIDEDLLVRELTPEAIADVKAETPMETQLEDGRIVKFRHLRMKDDRFVSRLMEGRSILQTHASIIQQLVQVEGIDSQDKFEFASFIENMEPGEFDLLREKIDEQDCGIDTELVVVCSDTDCGEEADLEIPLQKTFFQRRRMRTVDSVKRRKEKLRAQKERARQGVNG